MSRYTYVWSEKLQRLVEKGGPEHEQERAARSHLSAPMLIRDGMDALQSQVSGKFYDSKSALRAEYKHHGVVEMGTSAPTTPGVPERPKVTKREIARAINAVKNEGYRPSISHEAVAVSGSGSEWVD